MSHSSISLGVGQYPEGWIPILMFEVEGEVGEELALPDTVFSNEEEAIVFCDEHMTTIVAQLLDRLRLSHTLHDVRDVN
jgi:hypothetical protein